MNEVSLSELATYLLILAGLVSASAFFSGTEVAMFSLRRVDREQMSRSGGKLDELLLDLLSRVPLHQVKAVRWDLLEAKWKAEQIEKEEFFAGRALC